MISYKKLNDFKEWNELIRTQKEIFTESIPFPVLYHPAENVFNLN